MKNSKYKTRSYCYSKILSKDKLVNLLMFNGNKHMSETLTVNIFKTIYRMSSRNVNSVDVFKSFMVNVGPLVNARNVRYRRKNIFIPFFLTKKVRNKKVLRFLVGYSQKLSGSNKTKILASEILKSSSFSWQDYGKTNSLTKKVELYSLVQTNKAFAHYRWF